MEFDFATTIKAGLPVIVTAARDRGVWFFDAIYWPKTSRRALRAVPAPLYAHAVRFDHARLSCEAAERAYDLSGGE